MVNPLARAFGGQTGCGLTGGLCFTGVVSLERAALCSTHSLLSKDVLWYLAQPLSGIYISAAQYTLYAGAPL